MSAGIKSFVTEKQLDEKRKQRQEEWERVRKPEDPAEAPEEEYDSRSLYERLQEQKDKKQEEFEEKLKFKNQFRGIDQDESEFLQDVNRRNFEIAKQKRKEEEKELDEFRSAVAQAKELPAPSQSGPENEPLTVKPKKTLNPKKNPQQDILKNAVKRKGQTKEKKGEQEGATDKKSKLDDQSKGTIVYPSATKCIGILPGLAEYGDSENSDDSSSDESELLASNLLSQVVNKSYE